MNKKQMTTHTFTPNTIKIHWPLAREGQAPLAEISLKLPVYHDFLTLEQTQKLEGIDLEIAYLERLTGLKEAEILELKAPDYRVLSERLADYLQKKSDFFISIDPDSYENIPLLKPLGPMTHVSATIPTARAWKLIMQHQADTDKANKLAVGACFALSNEQMEQLSLPDWFLLLERATDFFTKTSDYFSAKKIFAN
ncbi:hypothetical protein [Spartinivicinus ruber]|uniref:hypothetical protein n=1 Tax=Spartinivicinus ruber TaxID=2683272 RepID=UPI0013D2965E|nr:hypothetical protein [Spartinivicinus ruber]